MSLEIEVRATNCDSSENVEWCRREEAMAFSVYVGKPGAFAAIADFFLHTEGVSGAESNALEYARDLGHKWGVPVYNRIEA